MLSRVAECLYWMSRYLERAEHTARLLDVNLHRALDGTSDAAEASGQRWDEALASLRAPAPPGEVNAYAVTRALAGDAANPASIVSCIAAARENARQVREGINSEMWEQLNRLYLHIRDAGIDAIWREPQSYFAAVREGSHLFQGITDATMSHGEGWQFIQAGRYIERASATAALLDVHFDALRAASSPNADDRDDREDAGFAYLEWVELLKSCTSFEAYLKIYTADIQPERVAEFLVLNADAPRSIRFSVAALQVALQAIARETGSRGVGSAERLAGRLRATLDYAGIDEIMSGDMHAYLEDVEAQCRDIHGALYQTYISPRQPAVGRRPAGLSRGAPPHGASPLVPVHQTEDQQQQ